MIIPNLKCLRLPAMKRWKATQKYVNILVLSHPLVLGDLDVTHRIHLWLDGKRIIDYVLVIVELFSLALTAASLLSEICRNRRFPTGCVTLSANFKGNGVSPTNDCWHQETRVSRLSYGVVYVILSLAILVHYRRVTDGRTDTRWRQVPR